MVNYVNFNNMIDVNDLIDYDDDIITNKEIEIVNINYRWYTEINNKLIPVSMNNLSQDDFIYNSDSGKVYLKKSKTQFYS